MASEAPAAVPQLHREQFTTVLHLKALRLQASQCQDYVKAMSGHMLNKARLKSIVKDPADPKARLLLLNEKVTGADLAGLPDELRERVTSANLQVVDYPLQLDYSYWSADHVLKRLLPEGAEVPSSFETVGHIAHLNIRDDLDRYKHVIGQVILDKNAHIKTVVNKVGTINSAYRVFQMEVVAGEPRFETEVVQFKARFRMDFSKVYWNSRLEHEHLRLVATFKRDDIILDVMAGIGPFAVPSGQKGCKVFANDLNPDSHQYLKENVRINKVAQHVKVYNVDGRDFIRDLSTSGGPLYTRVVMNLPASAVEFLDAFRGACSDERWTGGNLPMVHCYTFSKGEETHAGVRQRVEVALGGPLEKDPEIHLVREVAPNKSMLCVSFKLPAAVARDHSAASPVAADAPHDATAARPGAATAQPGTAVTQPSGSAVQPEAVVTQPGSTTGQPAAAAAAAELQPGDAAGQPGGSVGQPGSTTGQLAAAAAESQFEAAVEQPSITGQSGIAGTAPADGSSGAHTQELSETQVQPDVSSSPIEAAPAPGDTADQQQPPPPKKPRTAL